MRPRLPRMLFFLTLAFFAMVVSPVFGYELKTRYATVSYDREDLLREFNSGVSLGSLSYLLRGRKAITVDDEVRDKVDVVVERVESILDMFPRPNFRLVLLQTDRDVQRIYLKKYGRSVDYISFYSPREKAVYISVDDIRIGVLAHELAHVILDEYFGVSPPVKIHEVLAQFVETHLKD